MSTPRQPHPPPEVGVTPLESNPAHLEGVHCSPSLPLFPQGPAGQEPATGSGGCRWHWQPCPHLLNPRMCSHSGGRQPRLEKYKTRLEHPHTTTHALYKGLHTEERWRLATEGQAVAGRNERHRAGDFQPRLAAALRRALPLGRLLKGQGTEAATPDDKENKASLGKGLGKGEASANSFQRQKGEEFNW